MTSSTNPQKRCAHITIGPKPEDLEVAKKLLQSKCEFVFTQMDYKKVGPNDPHVTKPLEKSFGNGMKMSSSS